MLLHAAIGLTPLVGTLALIADWYAAGVFLISIAAIAAVGRLVSLKN
jgi:hypothetical protein